MTAELLEKVHRYCAYQDRSKSEVAQKLRQLGVAASEIPAVIEQLEADRFVSEERYARSFARGKFTYNRWGRQKIYAYLRSKHVPEDLIALALAEEIDAETYEVTLRKLLQQQLERTRQVEGPARHHKIVQSMQRKGYETDLITQALREYD
ncbi:MAG: regulatory protein RecX [Bacteroidia bacterium]